MHLHVVRVFSFLGGDEMKFAVIGAGVVGTALAVRLAGAGHTCVGVHTRSSASYARFKRYLDVPHLSLEELVPQVELLFITTQDSRIRSVVDYLAAAKLYGEGQVWIHCSGAYASELLRSDGLPVACLSIHPLQSFADVDTAVQLLEHTHFSVEGDRHELGCALVKDLGGIAHVISTENKALYHAGAVLASNYVVVLAALATNLFELAGIKRAEALPALLPLMEGALKNLSSLGLPQALTGPLVRGDIDVVRSHLEKMPEPWANAYAALAPEALELAVWKWSENGQQYPADVYEEFKHLIETSLSRSPGKEIITTSAGILPGQVA